MDATVIDTAIIIGIVGALFGHAIAWSFYPIQLLKSKLRIGDTELTDSTIRQAIIKAANCPSCCAFWVAFPIGFIATEHLWFTTEILLSIGIASIISHTIATFLDLLRD